MTCMIRNKRACLNTKWHYGLSLNSTLVSLKSAQGSLSIIDLTVGIPIVAMVALTDTHIHVPHSLLLVVPFDHVPTSYLNFNL